MKVLNPVYMGPELLKMKVVGSHGSWWFQPIGEKYSSNFLHSQQNDPRAALPKYAEVKLDKISPGFGWK